MKQNITVKKLIKTTHESTDRILLSNMPVNIKILAIAQNHQFELSLIMLLLHQEK